MSDQTTPATRRGRPGRRPRLAEQEWRELTHRAEALKRERPELTWREIAHSLGLAERTLHTYRRDLRSAEDGMASGT
jgi:hypothetical protein